MTTAWQQNNELIFVHSTDVREDECLKADACPPNFKCSNWPKQFSCDCPTEGFRYVEEGHGKTRNKQCLGKRICLSLKPI